MIPPQQSRQLIRLAFAIHEQLSAGQLNASIADLPVALWQKCEATQRRLRLAMQRGWWLAASRLRVDLNMSLGQLQAQLTIVHGTTAPICRGPTSTVREIHADLVALYDEFEEVTFDRRRQTLSVTTEPIELEGVYLGPFQIELNWRDLTAARPTTYRVIAVDEHPAEKNEGVTHPHVQDEALCEGDGKQPIQNALQHGRLVDFYLIVANLLRTYNSGSPFVALSDWHGVDCVDCGYTVSADNRRMCGKCDEYLCEDCIMLCPACDSDFCNECISRCEGCGERHCRACLETCPDCHEDFCPSCLEDRERCETCNDEKSNEEDSDESGECERPDGTVAAVHADSVGQDFVPA